jgi:hypothetical protein
MPDQEFMYKGKQISIREEHPKAVVSVDGREFHLHHHHEEAGLDHWMCDEAYFASADIMEMARHFADYGYMYDDPNRVVVNNEGEVVTPNGHNHHNGDHDHGHDEEGDGNGMS